MDLEVRAAKEEGIHNELSKKNDIVSPYERCKMLCDVMRTCRKKSQYEDIGTRTAIRILGSGHCGGVGAQRIEIYSNIYI